MVTPAGTVRGTPVARTSNDDALAQRSLELQLQRQRPW
jgi:hypothetical protein